MGLLILAMNFQRNRQREGVFSAHCDTGKNKGVRHYVMPQRTNATTDAAETAMGSSRLKHVQFERFKETGKERACPTYDDGKRKQSSATRLPLSKSCTEKSTLRKFQEVKVYRSFIKEEATEDSERLKNDAEFEKTTPGKVASHKTEPKTEACTVNQTRGATPPNHAIRRYALYRGMLSQ